MDSASSSVPVSFRHPHTPARLNASLLLRRLRRTMTTAARVWRRCLFYLNVAVSVPGDDSDTDTGVWLEMRRANRGGGGTALPSRQAPLLAACQCCACACARMRPIDVLRKSVFCWGEVLLKSTVLLPLPRTETPQTGGSLSGESET